MGWRYLLVLAVTVGCQTPATEPEPALGETTQAAVVTSPDGYDFGSLEVGQTTGAVAFTVNPYDLTYDEVHSVVESCPDFSIDAGGLPAAVYYYCEYEYDPCQYYGSYCPYCASYIPVSYTFLASFHPVVQGGTSCAFDINGPGGTLQQITVYGTGTLPPVDMTYSPPGIGFGDVRRNTTSGAAGFTVSSIGGQVLSVSSVSATAPFSVSGPSAYGLNPGNSYTHQVYCQPTGLGSVGGTLTVQSNDPDMSTVTIPLSCNGIDSNLDVSPSPATISTTRVNEPATQIVTLLNSGAAPMALQSVTLSGADMTLIAIPAPQMLNQNASVQAQVRFAATASGDATGTLITTYDGGQQRMTHVSARALATSMSINPDGNVDLGPVCVGQSTSKSFTIRANEPGPFRVNTISSLTAPLSVTKPSLPANIQGNGTNSASYMITAAPTGVGESTQTLSIATDIPGGAPRDIEVTMKGLPAGISPTPATVSLGASIVGATTLARPINITNCSTGSIALSNARLEGTDAGDFAIVLPPTSLSISPTMTATWLVVFQPQSAGAKQASFTVDTPSGPVTVAIDAEGLAGMVDEDLLDDGDVRASYYACAANGASGGGWLLAGAIALVLRRRRR